MNAAGKRAKGRDSKRPGENLDSGREKKSRTTLSDDSELSEACSEEDWPTDPIFFYGEKDENGWLSNFSPCSFQNNGVTYVCVEQYFQHAKAFLFNDSAAMEKILATKDPRKHKALGKSVQNFNADVWDYISDQVMQKALWLKFTSSPELHKKLIRVKNCELYEASTDKIWGCGLTKEKAKAYYRKAKTVKPKRRNTDKSVEDPDNRPGRCCPGQNQLGNMLMFLAHGLHTEELLKKPERLIC